ncbi:hypothetical protein [Candidatus Rickettsia kedanie]|uniref:hypothetical protein n=1 Tax=Candidatus Rickettsia kedanie TaxID=3115352 RepID=UPI00399D5332
MVEDAVAWVDFSVVTPWLDHGVQFIILKISIVSFLLDTVVKLWGDTVYKTII